MIFTIYTADCTGNEHNAVYPNKAVISNGEELKTAAAFDHVCAVYKDCLLYTSPSPRDRQKSRMPSSA